MSQRDDSLEQSLRKLKKVIGLASKRDSWDSHGHYREEYDVSDRYRNSVSEMDHEEIVVCFGVAECLVAFIGVLTIAIGVGIESMILQVFGAACLMIFIIGLITAGIITIGMYRRSVAGPEDPEVTK